MDDRQSQIKERAGLEESRINTEFLEFIKKWSTPVLLALVVLALGYRGWLWLEDKRLEKVDQAFGEYEAVLAGGNPNPDSLISLADEYQGVRSIGQMARLRAADIYLRAVNTGIRPGAVEDPTTGEWAEDDLLGDDEIGGYLDRAGSLYRQVLSSTRSDADRRLFAIGAAFGVAAVAETEGDMAVAREHYELVIDLAEAGGFDNTVYIARERIETIDTLEPAPTLYASNEVLDPIMPGLLQDTAGGLNEQQLRMPPGSTIPPPNPDEIIRLDVFDGDDDEGDPDITPFGEPEQPSEPAPSEPGDG